MLFQNIKAAEINLKVSKPVPSHQIGATCIHYMNRQTEILISVPDLKLSGAHHLDVLSGVGAELALCRLEGGNKSLLLNVPVGRIVDHRYRRSCIELHLHQDVI